MTQRDGADSGAAAEHYAEGAQRVEDRLSEAVAQSIQDLLQSRNVAETRWKHFNDVLERATAQVPTTSLPALA